MRLNVAIPEQHVSKPVLDAALEAVTRLNEDMIRAGDSPTSHQLLAQGARWQPEPPGAEHFDHGAKIASRGHGDCDDWAPLHAATLRVTGRDPGAFAEVRKSGPKRWHATVTRSDGSEDDPSLKAGMPGPGGAVGVRGAWLPVMRASSHGVHGAYINTPQLAIRPLADQHGVIESWQARTDLPWHWRPSSTNPTPADVAMVTLHRSPVSSQAICGAARGAFRLGLASGQADPEQLKHLSALCELCEGSSWEDVADRYGPEHATAAGAIVGSFFGKAFRKLGKVVKKVAAPLAKTALSFVPGGNLASAALSMASPALKKSVAKQKHAPPELRRPEAIARPSAPRPVSIHRPAAAPMQQQQQGMPQFLPYPYPLPYPVPGWSGGVDSPGVAWPPRA